jgi:hypothetical protein
MNFIQGAEMVQWTRGRCVAGARKVAAVLLVLAVAAACKPKESAANDTAPKMDSSTSVSLPPAVKGNPGLPGKPEDNATATRNYVLALGWGDNLPDSQIVNDEMFVWKTDSAMIRIVPNDTANTVPFDDAIKAGNGYFIAKVYNLADKAIPNLGLAKLGTGYLWVGQIPGAAGARGVAIYSLKNNGSLESNPKILKYLGRCDGQHNYAGVKLTDGNKCGFGAARTTSTAPKFILASMTNAATQRVSGGLWITCQGGCCEVSTQ